jgi:outer membrane protein TolC
MNRCSRNGGQQRPCASAVRGLGSGRPRGLSLEGSTPSCDAPVGSVAPGDGLERDPGRATRGSERCSPLFAALVLLAAVPALAAAAESPAVAGPTTPPALVAGAPLGLAEAVERALAVQPAVELAAARVAESVAGLGEAQASRGPTVRSQVSALQYDDPMVVSPIHGFGPGLFPPFDRSLLQASLVASYALLDGGLRSARTAQASAQEGLARAQATAVAERVASEVVASWAAVAAGRAVLAAEETRRTSLEAERERVAVRIAAGKAADVERLRTAAALAAATADRVRAAARLALAERELARLLAVAPEALREWPLAAQPLRGEVGSAAPTRRELGERARAASPRVASAQLLVASAAASRRVARAAYFPELRAQAAVQEFGDGDFDFTTDWNAGLQLSIPLWDGGVTRQRVARAAAQELAAAADARQAELEVEAALDRALAARDEAAARAAALAQAVESLAEVVRVEQLLVAAGAGTQTDYLAAEAELARTRAAAVEAESAALVASCELARLLGELTPAGLRRHFETPPAAPPAVGEGSIERGAGSAEEAQSRMDAAGNDASAAHGAGIPGPLEVRR